MLDTKLIRKSFSRASSSYDVNAFLQKRIGLELLENIKSDSIKPDRILDIGAGTGWLSQELSEYFNLRIFGIDSARGMVCRANSRKCLKAIQAEAENLPFKLESFDCLVSNLALQWVIDLDAAFKEAARVLRQDGYFYFSCFGPGTLEELKASLSANLEMREYFANFNPADENKIEISLKNNGFKQIDIRTEKLSENFSDLLSLLKWLKLIGANILDKPKFMRRQDLLRANEFYINNFSCSDKVYATFNLIKVKAIR